MKKRMRNGYIIFGFFCDPNRSVKHFLPLLFMLQLLILTTACNQNSLKNKRSSNESKMVEFEDSVATVKSILKNIEHEIYSSKIYKTDQQSSNGITACFEPPRLTLYINRNLETTCRVSGDSVVYDAIRNFYVSNFQKNDVTRNSPLYSCIVETDILKQISYIIQDIAQIKASDSIRMDYLEFKENQLQTWENRLSILKMTGKKELKEIELGSKISVEYQSKKGRDLLIDKVLISLYLLRDEACRYYFKKPMHVLYQKIPSDIQAKLKIDALPILLPIEVVDIPYCKKNKLYRYFNVPPPM